MVSESVPVALARASLHYFLQKGTLLPMPDIIADVFEGRAGVFVSLKKEQQLRGCIGTLAPTKPNIASEIIHNAISAGTADPRFEPVGLEELAEKHDVNVNITIDRVIRGYINIMKQREKEAKKLEKEAKKRKIKNQNE